MGLTKSDTAVAVALGLLLLGGRKALASSPVIPASRRREDDEADGAHLVARANQAPALAWADVFAALKVRPADGGDVHPYPRNAAEALARWTGIESSGDPLATSSRGERGLMQAGPQSVEEGALLPAEWDALIDPNTGPSGQASIAVRYVDWLWGRARRFVKDAPPNTADHAVDHIWYSKLYHQRPVDLRDGRMHGPALAMARELAQRWANDPKAMHRLRAANVVAWGNPSP